MATKVRALKPPPGVLQLHIELRRLKPKVWRRVLVPDTITLAKLHLVIQRAFQWGGHHLHEFMAGEERYGTADLEWNVDGELRSERTRLVNAVTPSGTIDYIYDFGDNWNHRIKIERVLPPLGMELPMCVGGANATPPDDCGGTGGYEELVAVLADPSHPEHEEMKTWVGGEWDPVAFDLVTINSWLAEIKL